MTILDEIFEYKRLEVALQKAEAPLPVVIASALAAPPPLDFVAALAAGREERSTRPALVAEVKRGSPSRGLLARDFDPLRLARIYRENGAAAISVLTDERYFGGHLDYLRRIVEDGRGESGSGLRPPVLRKDFLYDPYQVYQARAAGADAVLLITAALDPAQLRDLHALGLSLGMAPLVEVHTLEELETALAVDPVLIGINNRNLHDFTVNLETTLRLRPSIPAGVLILSESGIQTMEDVGRLAQAGVDAILVGEALVSARDVAARVRELAGRVMEAR